MLTGYLTKDWANTHHRLWEEEVEKESAAPK
jgi:cytochrome b subunit of formate dehydrogenase